MAGADHDHVELFGEIHSVLTSQSKTSNPNLIQF